MQIPFHGYVDERLVSWSELTQLSPKEFKRVHYKGCADSLLFKRVENETRMLLLLGPGQAKPTEAKPHNHNGHKLTLLPNLSAAYSPSAKTSGLKEWEKTVDDWWKQATAKGKPAREISHVAAPRTERVSDLNVLRGLPPEKLEQAA